MKLVAHFVLVSLTVAGALFLPPRVHATLIDRGGGLIYDDVLGITWMQDAKLIQTSGFDADGQLNWNAAVAWADGLVVSNSHGTYDDWRLASMDLNRDFAVVDCAVATELACRDNEYGYLFHHYGISSFSPGVFLNVGHDFYWSASEFEPNPAVTAWGLDFKDGGTNDLGKNFQLFTWAVRDGDVVSVPEPSTLSLLGAGLLGVFASTRRKRST